MFTQYKLYWKYIKRYIKYKYFVTRKQRLNGLVGCFRDICTVSNLNGTQWKKEFNNQFIKYQEKLIFDESFCFDIMHYDLLSIIKEIHSFNSSIKIKYHCEYFLLTLLENIEKEEYLTEIDTNKNIDEFFKLLFIYKNKFKDELFSGIPSTQRRRYNLLESDNK